MEVEGFKGEVVSLVWKRVMCLQGQGGLMSGGAGLTDGCLYYISGQLLELLYPMVTAGLAACCAFSNKTKQLGVVAMLVDTLHVSYTSISVSGFELCLRVVYSSETT